VVFCWVLSHGCLEREEEEFMINLALGFGGVVDEEENP
jgi:hypothetical protein